MTEIVADRIQLLGSGGGGGASRDRVSDDFDPGHYDPSPGPQPETPDDDIPF